MRYFAKCCNSSLILSDSFRCVILDYDECNTTVDFHTDICGENEKCVNTELSFRCQCKEGFENNGTACVGEFILVFNVVKVIIMILPLLLYGALLEIASDVFISSLICIRLIKRFDNTRTVLHYQEQISSM